MFFFKKILKYLTILLVAIILFVVSFYFWGGSNTISYQKYNDIYKYNGALASSDDSVFSIITYNIGYLSGMTNNLAVSRKKKLFENNLQQVIRSFNIYKPDIIVLQEVDFNAKRSYYIDQAETLAKSIKLYYNAIAINWDKRYVPFPYFPPSIHFGKILSGQAVLSRYIIEKNERIVLEKVDSNPFYYNQFYLDRLAQVCTLKILDRTLVVINVHLEAFDKDTRLKQSQQVWQLYEKWQAIYPTILLGDFNSYLPEGKASAATINYFLNKKNIASVFPSQTFNQSSSMTYPASKPIEKIDYIFYDPNEITPISWKRIDEVKEASDHLPIMMVFKFTER